jgi:hypothetical protein
MPNKKFLYQHKNSGYYIRKKKVYGYTLVESKFRATEFDPTDPIPWTEISKSLRLKGYPGDQNAYRIVDS